MDLLPSETNCVIAAIMENLLRFRLPTYFVEPEFLMACDYTKPPLDIKFSDIKLPLDSMLFVLPQGYIFNSIKWRIPYIAFSKIDANQVVSQGGKTLPVGKDILGFQFLFIPDDGFAISYASWYHLGHDLTTLFKDDAYFEDTTAMERKLFNSISEGLGDSLCKHDCPIPPQEEEREIIGKLTQLAVKILLVLSARSGMISSGSIAREARFKKGQLSKDALWHPSYIGKGYKIKTEANYLGGSHLSPRMHFRIGHQHTVRFGPQKSLSRIDWYEPILVNGPK
jgi:hypothetical protein